MIVPPLLHTRTRCRRSNVQNGRLYTHMYIICRHNYRCAQLTILFVLIGICQEQVCRFCTCIPAYCYYTYTFTVESGIRLYICVQLYRAN